MSTTVLLLLACFAGIVYSELEFGDVNDSKYRELLDQVLTYREHALYIPDFEIVEVVFSVKEDNATDYYIDIAVGDKQCEVIFTVPSDSNIPEFASSVVSCWEALPEEEEEEEDYSD